MTLKKTTIPQLPVATTFSGGYLLYQQGSTTKIIADSIISNDIENNVFNSLITNGLNGVMVVNKDGAAISPTSADYSFLSNRDIDTDRNQNAYGFYDANIFNKSYDNASYASFSSNTTLSGNKALDHFNGFQARATLNKAGTIVNFRAFVDNMDITAGTITNRISFYSGGQANAGTITNWYGVKIDRPTGGTITNLIPIWIEGGDSFLGDSVSLLQDYTSKNGGFFKSFLQAANNEYETSLGARAADGVGVLTLGNRGVNQIRLGRNQAGGRLEVYINNTVGPNSNTDGTLAFAISNAGVLSGNQLEPISGAFILNFTGGDTYLGKNGAVFIAANKNVTFDGQVLIPNVVQTASPTLGIATFDSNGQIKYITLTDLATALGI